MGLLKVAIDRLLTTDPAGWLGHKLTEPQDPMPETIGEAMDMIRTNAKMAIDSATEQLQAELAKHRWISVGERLPEHERKVLVTDGRYFWTDRYQYDKDRWENLIPGGGDNVEYTHWRPIILPEGE